MIKVKSKIVKTDDKNEYVAVKYNSKHTNTNEHLVVVNHLLHKILDTKMYTKKELLKLIVLYLEKGK